MNSASANALIRRQEQFRLTGAYPLYSLKHLALSSGATWGYLRRVVRRHTSAYRPIRIPKRTSGTRDLLSPHDALMSTQRWILHHLLEERLARHPNNFAYSRRVTTKQCVERHAGAKWMIKTDLHDYFPSVDERMVYRVFRRLGYSPLLSFELARICTWNPPRGSKTRVKGGGRQTSLHPYGVGGRTLGVLPQGAPTSGALANAATWRLDVALTDFALRNGLVYTRYSDDMAFSSTGAFDRNLASTYIGQIRRIITSNGFSVHEKKTKVIPPGARKVLLGMLVADAGVAVLPEHRRKIDFYIHAVTRYGPVSVAQARNFPDALMLINHVDGWLAYLIMINPSWAKQRRRDWDAALASHDVYPSAISSVK
ncbi:MAG: reverse transcriptase family protein [Rhodoglobus sp.]